MPSMLRAGRIEAGMADGADTITRADEVAGGNRNILQVCIAQEPVRVGIKYDHGVPAFLRGGGERFAVNPFFICEQDDAAGSRAYGRSLIGEQVQRGFMVPTRLRTPRPLVLLPGGRGFRGGPLIRDGDDELGRRR